MKDPMTLEQVITAIAQLGLPVCLVVFWTWTGNQREALLNERMKKLEEAFQSALTGALTEATKAITRNTEALSRVEQVIEQGLCPLSVGDVAEAKRRHELLTTLSEHGLTPIPTKGQKP